MNIVHINTADISGGAAQATYALHRALLKRGHQSRMLVAYKYSQDPEVDDVWFYKTKMRKGIQYGIGAIEAFTGFQYLLQPFSRSILSHSFLRDADVIHLHNLHGNYISPRTLPALGQKAPLVWTLYDFWPMSGHCTYPQLTNCMVWKTGQGRCTQLDDYPSINRDTEALLWRYKQKVYQHMPCTIVGPSEWMCAQAHQSPLLKKFSIRHIAQGIDTVLFQPGDRADVRKRLGIPNDVRVVLVSALPNAPRKGLPLFLKSLQYLTVSPRPWIVVVGSRGLVAPHAKGFPIVEMGYVGLEQLKEFFVAADLFVLPTRADNLPLTIMESMGCGTPVVSFDIGGVGEVVKAGVTGYLARAEDPQDLATGINQLLSDNTMRVAYGANAARLIHTQYSIEQQAKGYEELYQKLLIC